MNDVSQNKKDSVLKSLAIAGFIGIIILIAWLSVQLVSIVPGAFSSLASLAESLNQTQQSGVENESPSIIVTSNTTLAKAGESVELSWTTSNTPGSYIFSYECSDGVAVDITNIEGVRSIACDTNYNIGNISLLSLTIDSEKERYTDMNYTIAFLGTNDVEPRASGFSSITVINSEVQTAVTSEDDSMNSTETEVATPTESEPTVETTPAETVTEVATPVETKPVEVSTPTPTTPAYEQEFVYTIPVSDPNGRTDLSAKFLDAGTIIGNTFFAGKIKQNESGAIQFEVKNLGTKTSDNWTFAVTLPEGNTYNSAVQNPLKPNERAVITIGFSGTNDSSHTFIVTTDEPTDSTVLNDRFAQTVTFTK